MARCRQGPAARRKTLPADPMVARIDLQGRRAVGVPVWHAGTCDDTQSSQRRLTLLDSALQTRTSRQQ